MEFHQKCMSSSFFIIIFFYIVCRFDAWYSVYNRVFNTCSLLLISMKSREIQSSTRALPINLSFCTYLLDYKRNGFIFYMYRVRSHTHTHTYLKKKEEEKGSQHLTNNTPYFISLRLNFTPSKKKKQQREEKIYNY